MAWGSKTQIINSASVTDTESYSTAVSLNPGELAHVQVEGDPPGGPSDNLLVRVYGTLDASSEVWDTTPVYEFSIDKDTDPNNASFIVSGLYKFRLGVLVDGATDTWTVDAYYRVDGVNL